MGFKRERRIYNLIFDDPEFNGLEVKVRSIPIRELRHLMSLDTEASDRIERAKAIDTLMQSFAGALVSWNMEDDNGRPLPTSLEYIESEDVDFIMMIVGQWLQVIARVGDDTPLPGTSSTGSQFLEGSIQMEPLSKSLAS